MSGRPLPPNRKIPGRKRPAPEARDPDLTAAADPRGPSADAADAVAARKPARGGSVEAGVRQREALSAVAGVLLTVGTALGAVFGLVHYTRTSPRFAIGTIEVTGAAHLSPAEIAASGGIERGKNIFSIDLERARARILENPWIERASAVRRLPGTVHVDVVERDAAALVAVGADLYLATRQGELFKRLEPSDPYDLPVITGLDRDDFARDREGAMSTVQRALDLAAEYERVGPARTMPVEEVHVDEDGAFSLEVGKPPVALRLGKGPFRRALEQAARVLVEVARRKARAEVVFADNEAHPERVVVRMR